MPPAAVEGIFVLLLFLLGGRGCVDLLLRVDGGAPSVALVGGLLEKFKELVGPD